MAKINRHTGNLTPFGQNAFGGERTVFGEATTSDTLDGNLTADYFRGWGADTSPNQPPFMKDFNAAMFTATQFIAYLMQSGIPEYNAGQTYYTGGMASSNGTIYVSQSDNNTNNLLTDPVHWKKLLTDELALKQDNLVSGVDIKSINGLSILNAGNVNIGLGEGQTWKQVTRAYDTDHYNHSGRAIFVVLGIDFLNTIDTVDGFSKEETLNRSYVIPNGSYYRHQSFNAPQISSEIVLELS